ncbi:pyrroloquinoline quinone biosynthesis protein PqqB [Halomonas sp. MCCC 1A17488]|uniref:Coenzyme PQQ synthesis protein B n=1 Tax=Billgrantia sulfidoxydans TaxID=2733484 RepID=A0ABX7W8W0_9GAMM|nr:MULTISPECIES: pyrroloquinoline quinone biosynthesis protein PqqB [Halomonas]MCE8018492.1 pyrroloquinoline quinone biosynthesis protein PqqB [Halomonas sp. MCCC 1A17488]MCG3241825.1 pyrroloquinoline quinone biosynthesis protein PqqB [Halomonas sp. MCCC 1A17488]QPP49189.1 pyrroloquinoline quinone biosynthesis protein PqqB [Halomonas sp. SS10-MC5]QTP56525.1 pyrroloquinoline quinone biosynthesis protein PqqB [Halomonas sulfidoxydans]
MHVLVLGAAAGGGFPQWNCNCSLCRGLREGRIDATPRTQSSIAISSDGERWLLCNASPDIRAQLAANPELHPRRIPRDSGISGVLLVDAQIDHATGLLSLREGCPFDVWCTPNVHQDLSSGFPLFTMLEHWGGLAWRPIAIDEAHQEAEFEVPACPGLAFTAVALTSNAPPYSPRRGAPTPGDNIGLLIEDRARGTRLFYAPGLGRLDERVRGFLRQANCVLVDGTLWHDDELIRAGVGQATGTDMGHLALAGSGGLLEALGELPRSTRRVLIHINNTNPLLDERSPERAVLDETGIEVAFDGMRLEI